MMRSIIAATGCALDPTGVADSAPAFDAAIAANQGKAVWIPRGTYNITRHIIVNNVTLDRGEGA
jgi:polygalacturonase